MKIIIFAGGAGTRLWPLSRQNSPKQFEKFFDGKSTFQLAIERVLPIVGAKNIYISTNNKYSQILQEQAPKIPKQNYIFEPAKRDLAPAIGRSFMKLKSDGYTGSIAIIWSDHLMERLEEFQRALKTGDELINQNPNQFIFLGEKPRFANQNLGWITTGDKIGNKNKFDILEYKSWSYRPELSKCKKMFTEQTALWNPGYFVTSVEFVLNQYQKYMPEMYSQLLKIQNHPETLNDIYPTLESISFDDAILVNTKPDQAQVLKLNMGWNDPGTLYALKTALAKNTKSNATKGTVQTIDTTDSLILNYEKDKVVSAIGLDGFIVINMDDALIVVHKDRVPDVKKMVGQLKDERLGKFV